MFHPLYICTSIKDPADRKTFGVPCIPGYLIGNTYTDHNRLGKRTGRAVMLALIITILTLEPIDSHGISIRNDAIFPTPYVVNNYTGNRTGKIFDFELFGSDNVLHQYGFAALYATVGAEQVLPYSFIFDSRCGPLKTFTGWSSFTLVHDVP